MKWEELTPEEQQTVKDGFAAWANKHESGAWHVLLTNADGTRYFDAKRIPLSGQYHAYDGGSHWRVRYGKITWRRVTRQMIGFAYSELEVGPSGKQRYNKAANGTEVPEYIDKKKDVMALAKAIGIFNV